MITKMPLRIFPPMKSFFATRRLGGSYRFYAARGSSRWVGKCLGDQKSVSQNLF